MEDILNDEVLDLAVGGATVKGYTYCPAGTPQGGGAGLYGEGTTCNTPFITWFQAEMKSHGLGQPH